MMLPHKARLQSGFPTDHTHSKTQIHGQLDRLPQSPQDLTQSKRPWRENLCKAVFILSKIVNPEPSKNCHLGQRAFWLLGRELHGIQLSKSNVSNEDVFESSKRGGKLVARHMTKRSGKAK